MFSPKSRYAGAGTYTVQTTRGKLVTATKLPVRSAPLVRGVHTRTDVDRLDHLAAHYLGEPSESWRLCDANEAIAPDALAARDQVAIPKKDR